MQESMADPGNTRPDDPAHPEASSQKEGARVRSFFPETLLSAPFVETDANGSVSMDIALADSITTWRATAVANSADGKYGASTFGIRVFQPFFVDFDLPSEVTRGDVIEVPLVVYNFESDARNVKVLLEAEEGLHLLQSDSFGVDVEGGSVKAVKIPIEATRVGEFTLTANAQSADVSDAVVRSLSVVPDGRPVEVVRSGVLAVTSRIPIEIPHGIVEGSAKLLVKLYPGKASMSSEGAEDILMHPSGCFEQTTSAAWPNVMVLAMLLQDPGADPQVIERARDLVNEGYQRILTFQHSTGGFSWWGGNDSPELAVTALGLMQLVDTAAVHPVDDTVIQRTAHWLAERQNGDGSFDPDTHLHSGNMSIGETKLRMTAYAAWALSHAGLEPEAVAEAVDYLKAHADEVEDPYTLSLSAMALDTSGLEPHVKASFLEQLQARQAGDGSIESENPTMYYSYGTQGTAENTAVGGLALLAGSSMVPATIAAGWIAENRMGSWGYGNTQTTVQALRLMNSVTLGPPIEEDITVTVHYDGLAFAGETITVENADVLRQFDLSNLVSTGNHVLEISATLESNIQYEVIAIYHMPWTSAGGPETHLRLDVDYDHTHVRVGEFVTVTARISTEQDDNMPLAEIGIPPGFVLETDALQQAGEDGLITRYELKNGKLALYFNEILRGEPAEVTFQLKAGMVIDAVVPSSVVYPYYNPDLKYETPSFPVSVSE